MLLVGEYNYIADNDRRSSRICISFSIDNAVKKAMPIGLLINFCGILCKIYA